MSSTALRERHIDHLLSEKLETSLSFSSWFARKVFGDRVPGGEPASCSTEVGHHRVVGETDILVEMKWSEGVSAVIHVEDKLSALPQPDQASRYGIAVKQSGAVLAASALAAPQAWMRRHPRETVLYDAAIALEEIAGEIGSRAAQMEKISTREALELARRLRWREQLLSGSMIRRAVYGAIRAGELDHWNSAAAEVIAATNGLQLRIAPRQRSAGRNMDSRFFMFEERLSPLLNGSAPRLRLKTAGVRRVGRVSLEVPKASDNEDLVGSAQDAGFKTTKTKAGTLIVEDTTEALRALDIAKSVMEQIDGIEDAAEVGQSLIEWWEKVQGGPA